MITKLNNFFAWLLLRMLLCLHHSDSIKAELHYLYCYYRYDAHFSVLSLVDSLKFQRYCERIGSVSESYIAAANRLFGSSDDK